jgi:acyl transferase domain-containing protein
LQVNHARKPVRFDQAAKKLVEDKEFNIVIDVGPQPFVWNALRNSGDHENYHFLAACAKQGKDQDIAFLECLASLFESGVTLDFALLYDKADFVKVKLPTYPWQRERHYPNYVPSRKATSTTDDAHSAKQAPQLNGNAEQHIEINGTAHATATAKHLDLLNAHLIAAGSQGASPKKSPSDVEPFIVSCVKDVLEFSSDKDLGKIVQFST